METTTQKGHPPGLYFLSTVEMWERFSYYSMRAILVLYMTTAIAEGGLGYGEAKAYTIYGWFTGLVYLLTLLGGYMADNYLGRRKSITIGGFLMMFGQFALASNMGAPSLYLGLGLLCFGNGFFKPNISTIVGDLYTPGDGRKDAAFTIFYMGINLGALIGPIVMGEVTKSDVNPGLGYNYGFIAAGCGMLLGQLMYNLISNKYIGDLGNIPTAQLKKQQVAAGTSSKELTKAEKNRMLVIGIIVTFTIFFWMAFEQAGSSLNIYTDKFIDRKVGETILKTASFQSVNPLFILLLAPIFSILWLRLAAQGKEPSTPVKMGLGMILLGLGYLFMVKACAERGEAWGVAVGDVNIKAGLHWLVLTYLFHTMGELCISPVGLSMITKLAPMQFASLMMGVWFGSVFVANVLGGYVAILFTQYGAYDIFMMIAGIAILLGLILLAISGKLTKMMHGIK